jgi:hypothetical protein
MLRANRADDQDRLTEFEATVRCHDAQQRMVTEFLERWRTRDDSLSVPIAG